MGTDFRICWFILFSNFFFMICNFLFLMIQIKPSHYVLGIQVLNPPHNETTEKILIYDNPTIVESARIWDLKRDLMNFPTTSKSHGIVIKYESGSNAIGNIVLVITCTSGILKLLFKLENCIIAIDIHQTVIRRIQLEMICSIEQNNSLNYNVINEVQMNEITCLLTYRIFLFDYSSQRTALSSCVKLRIFSDVAIHEITHQRERYWYLGFIL